MMIYINTLKVNNLRGHIQSGSLENYNVDLKAMYLKADDKIYVLPGSSMKGVLRKNAKILKCNTSMFGGEFGVNKMGKIIVGWGYIMREHSKKVRYGIKLDERLGVVEKGALYSFEYLPEVLEVRFEVRPLTKLSNDELSCLAKSISLLKYYSIGWGGSKGIGIIEEVILDDKLLPYLGKK